MGAGGACLGRYVPSQWVAGNRQRDNTPLFSSTSSYDILDASICFTSNFWLSARGLCEGRGCAETSIHAPHWATLSVGTHEQDSPPTV
jgi:hypothetical protein